MNSEHDPYTVHRRLVVAVTVTVWLLGAAVVTDVGGSSMIGVTSALSDVAQPASSTTLDAAHRDEEPAAPNEEGDSVEVLDAGGEAGATVLSAEEVHDDRWIAQLASVPITSGHRSLVRRWRRISQSAPDAQVLRSRDFAALRPGYWVVYDPGPFASGREAVTFCRSIGFDSKNECVGRYLSTKRADRGRQCFRTTDGRIAGTCT